MRAVRAPKSQRRTTAHATKERLLDAATALVEAFDIGEITSEMVLESSGISRGSLYHHFEDFSDLLEQALVRKFAALVDANIVAFEELLRSSRSQADMLAGLSLAARAIHAPERSANRFFRARIIALSEANPRLTLRLAAEQKRLTDALADLFAENQRRGWMRPGVNPAVASIFVQAYTLGRVIDDVAAERIDPEEWNAFIDDAIHLLFC